MVLYKNQIDFIFINTYTYIMLNIELGRNHLDNKMIKPQWLTKLTGNIELFCI